MTCMATSMLCCRVESTREDRATASPALTLTRFNNSFTPSMRVFTVVPISKSEAKSPPKSTMLLYSILIFLQLLSENGLAVGVLDLDAALLARLHHVPPVHLVDGKLVSVLAVYRLRRLVENDGARLQNVRGNGNLGNRGTQDAI